MAYMGWIQAIPRALNAEESNALALAIDSTRTLIADLIADQSIDKSNARISVRQLLKVHPVTRSLGVSEATVANLVALV